jgi:hypothetical protein
LIELYCCRKQKALRACDDHPHGNACAGFAWTRDRRFIGDAVRAVETPAVGSGGRPVLRIRDLVGGGARWQPVAGTIAALLTPPNPSPSVPNMVCDSIRLIGWASIDGAGQPPAALGVACRMALARTMRPAVASTEQKAGEALAE